MKLISLFSGIGGFELAAEWVGWKPVLSCEINDFGRKVLTHYWPDSYHHDDIKTLTIETINDELTKRFGTDWNSNNIILTGGFPCQPYSVAGKRLGKEDERHLWPEMLRIIQAVQPKWIVGENVSGLVNWSNGLVFDEVQTDLEAAGYEVIPFILPACSVNAPHRRDRIWFIAYSASNGYDAKSTKRNNGIRQNNIESREGRVSTIKGLGNERTSTNSESMGWWWWWCKTSSERKNIIQQSRYKGLSKSRNVTNTTGKGLEGVLFGESILSAKRIEKRVTTNTNGIRQTERFKQYEPDKQGQFGWFSDKNDWTNFPTQSPICSRNDGVSSGLVGITVPKHRNESIKAYGNAIVPQVAYQIFKAIVDFERIGKD